METSTVKELRAIAKERGVKKYYAMRKADLIAAIKAATEPFVLIKSKSALKKITDQYTIDVRAGYDPESFLKEVKELVTDELQTLRQTKVKMVLRCMMMKTNIATGEHTIVEAAFNSDVEINLNGSDVNEIYDRMVDKTRENLAAFQMRGSNWVFASVVRLEIYTVRYEPLKGSSYIPLPKKLASKKVKVKVKVKVNVDLYSALT